MAIQTFTSGQVLTAAQVNSLQANDFNQTVSTKTANYTLAAADKGTRVVMNVSSASTITVNTSLFSAGDTVILQNIAANNSTVTAGTATVSSAGPLAIPQYGSGTLYFTSTSAAIFFPSAVTIPPAASGLVFITSGTITNTTSVNNCFSATYLNYKIVFENLVSGDSSAVLMRMRASGTDNSSSLYSYIQIAQNTSNGSILNTGVGRDTTEWDLGAQNNYTNGQSFAFDLFSPFAAKNTHRGEALQWQTETNFAAIIGGMHKSTTSFDGFTIYPTSSTLAGTYRVYGYANS